MMITYMLINNSIIETLTIMFSFNVTETEHYHYVVSFVFINVDM